MELGGFDQHTFGKLLQLLWCEDCGLVYNTVIGGKKEVNRYYVEEALYSSHDGTGSGGTTVFDQERYLNIYNILKRHLKSYNSQIIDIGCGHGGFLIYLQKQGCINLFQ